MANALTFDQVSTTLNAIMQQATGQAESLTPIDTASFVAVANKTLQTGYDTVMKAISQVLSRTIFSVRPYTAKFGGLMADSIRYGNHVRKITYLSGDAVNSKVYDLPDGQSVDQYIVNKPKVVQTNFYGGNVWQDYITRFEEQLDMAFSSPEEFGRFWSGVITEMTNKREQQNEVMSRAALVNFVGGKLAGDTSNVIHLLSEYNALTGLALTATTVYNPDNYSSFMRWVYARIAGICAMLTERSGKFHTNLSDGGKDQVIMRHTPYDRQKIYMSAQSKFEMDALVLASTYHDSYLKYADVEIVNYWQNIDEPMSISAKASYLGPDGTVKSTEDSSPATTNVLFGAIFDEEAVGVTTINESLNATPFNARGRYTNLWWSANYRWWNDFTENGVVLLLD